MRRSFLPAYRAFGKRQTKKEKKNEEKVERYYGKYTVTYSHNDGRLCKNILLSVYVCSYKKPLKVTRRRLFNVHATIVLVSCGHTAVLSVFSAIPPASASTSSA